MDGKRAREMNIACSVGANRKVGEERISFRLSKKEKSVVCNNIDKLQVIMF